MNSVTLPGASAVDPLVASVGERLATDIDESVLAGVASTAQNFVAPDEVSNTAITGAVLPFPTATRSVALVL